MNKTLEKFARDTLKENLEWLALRNTSYIRRFKQMYSPGNLDLSIVEVVDNMPAEKLDWALTQVQNTFDKILKT